MALQRPNIIAVNKWLKWSGEVTSQLDADLKGMDFKCKDPFFNQVNINYILGSEPNLDPKNIPYELLSVLVF